MKSTILSLILVAGLSAVGFFQFEKFQRTNQDLQRHVSKLEKEMKVNVADLQSTIGLLQGQDQSILKQMKMATWTNAEIDYLITLAATQLEIRYDVSSAITLLTQAQQKIQLQNDPRYGQLEEAIALDLLTLQRLSPNRTQALWTELGDLSHKTLSLPLNFIERTQPTPETEQPVAKDWKSVFLSSVDQLKSLVKIRKHAKPIEPLLSQSEQGLVRENLRLILEQARVALLARDQMIYEEALQDAMDWLDQYYATGDKETQKIYQTLSTLSKETIKPSLTALSSIQQLDSIR